MRFSLSTNWNVRRHTAGEALADETSAPLPYGVMSL
jgi:hypothetical protein